MLNMSQINDIRDLYNSGYKISEIHKKTGVDPKTIRKYLSRDDFSEFPESSVARPSVLDPFKPTILKWLEEDKQHWKKQLNISDYFEPPVRPSRATVPFGTEP